jgi:hypothetical protein
MPGITVRGPSAQQTEAWLRDLEGLQWRINNNDDVLCSKFYVKSMLNILTDLIESFRNPDETCCRRCGRVITPQTQAWDGLCQPCFDEIIGQRLDYGGRR